MKGVESSKLKVEGDDDAETPRPIESTPVGNERGMERVCTFKGLKVGTFGGREKMENEGDKGRRSFLRRVEGQGEYNAKYIRCQYSF